MSNCHTCWWADFHEKAPGQHIVHEEPDYLQMKSAFAAPTMIRIVQSCAKGKEYFKSFGMAEHNCSEWKDFALADKMQEQVNKQKAKTWTGKTSRPRLPISTNLFDLLPMMSEDNANAYNIILDHMGAGENVGELIINLNDMNIRGEQIVLAHMYCEANGKKLVNVAKWRGSKMVAYVNKHSKNKDELAVQDGAHAYGHKNVKIKPVARKMAEVEAIDTGKTVKTVRKLIRKNR
jgi:hypothetical protein